MGSKAKRQAIDKLLGGGELEAVESVGDPIDAAPDAPLDAAWLAEIREQRARLAANPDEELPAYREFYKKPELTQHEADQLLQAQEKAIGAPEAFYDEIMDAVAEEGFFDALKLAASCAIRIPRFYPTREPSAAQEQVIAKLRDDFALGDVAINPNDHRYELCDPSWWRLWKVHAVAMKKWPEGLANFIAHGGDRTFVYDDARGAKQVALMADFGVGQYHSRLIARQLEAKRYPYVFHLGDIYYAGTEAELQRNYADVLARTMEQSLLFSMPENHELYSGGFAWQSFLQQHRGQILQEGSYFCVRYAKHQIIGLDVNWNRRQRFDYEVGRAWLDGVLAGHEDLTTILLTGSAPFEYGKPDSKPLYDDLAHWHRQGRFALWFWGDDHYGALFKRVPGRADFVGSCIGHAGFPGDRMAGGKPSFVDLEWLEEEPRFPAGYDLRDDLGNNGWVELTLLDSGGVELLYVDWLGCRRFRARFDLDPAAPGRQLRLADREAFPVRTRSFP
jgi:hypothetical protein